MCALRRARVLAMAACGRACVRVCVLSWLNSRSAGTNYNEPRLVGRESAMFSFLCPVVYRPFYRGRPPRRRRPRCYTPPPPTHCEPEVLLPQPPPPVLPPALRVRSAPACGAPPRAERPPSHPGRIPATIPRRNCPPRLLSHGICLQCGIRARGRKKCQLFESGTKGAARKSAGDAWRRIACVSVMRRGGWPLTYVGAEGGGVIYDERPCVGGTRIMSNSGPLLDDETRSRPRDRERWRG
jgi:hypothetical protein